MQCSAARQTNYARLKCSRMGQLDVDAGVAALLCCIQDPLAMPRLSVH